MSGPVLVVAAHPDDEVLGAGATIARMADDGRSVTVLIVGEGVTSRTDVGTGTITGLRSETAAAAAVLGVADVVHVGLPDNRLDSVNLLDVVKAIEEQIARIGPTTVLCQSGGDVNIDHQVLHQAVLAATRPLPGHPVRSVLAFEVASSTEWAFGRNGGGFCPTVFVDATRHMSRKLEALAAYASELRPWPHPRSLENVEYQLRLRGSSVGLDAAEAFEVVREIR